MYKFVYLFQGLNTCLRDLWSHAKGKISPLKCEYEHHICLSTQMIFEITIAWRRVVLRWIGGGGAPIYTTIWWAVLHVRMNEEYEELSPYWAMTQRQFKFNFNIDITSGSFTPRSAAQSETFLQEALSGCYQLKDPLTCSECLILSSLSSFQVCGPLDPRFRGPPVKNLLTYKRCYWHPTQNRFQC